MYKLHTKLTCILEMTNIHVVHTHYLLSIIVICLKVYISRLIMNLSSILSILWVIKAVMKLSNDRILKYGTAQRQLDTYTHAAGWILSDEDYVMHSVFERVLVTFVSVSGKLSGVCNRKRNIILYELLNNINSIYTMNLRILSLYALINPWIHCPTEELVSCPTVWLGAENGFGVENGFFIGDWISINLFEFVQSVVWKVRKYQY